MARLLIPDADAKLGELDGVSLYFLDYNESQPLYRRCKLIGDNVLPGRRTAYLSWIVYRGEFVRIGDAWRIQSYRPELHEWARQHMATTFDVDYLKDTFDLSDAQVNGLIAADKIKYPRS